MGRYWWCDSNVPDIIKRNALMENEIGLMKGTFRKGIHVPIEAQAAWDVPFKIETIDLKLNIDDPDEIYWLITFKFHKREDYPKAKFHSDKIFKLKVVYDNRHPYKEPKAYPYYDSGNDFTMFRLRLDYHQFDDGSLCLWDHTSSTENGWDPATGTGLTIALWGIQWFRAMLRAKKTGDFPATA